MDDHKQDFYEEENEGAKVTPKEFNEWVETLEDRQKKMLSTFGQHAFQAGVDLGRLESQLTEALQQVFKKAKGQQAGKPNKPSAIPDKIDWEQFRNPSDN